MFSTFVVILYLFNRNLYNGYIDLACVYIIYYFPGMTILTTTKFHIELSPYSLMWVVYIFYLLLLCYIGFIQPFYKFFCGLNYLLVLNLQKHNSFTFL